MKLTFLGSADEIGASSTLLEVGETKILIDAGGNFLVYKQIDKPIWAKMKAAGARYYTTEMIEDFDMFGREPGWRYSLDAIGELIKSGLAVNIEKRVFISVEDLFNFYQETHQNEQI